MSVSDFNVFNKEIEVVYNDNNVLQIEKNKTLNLIEF